MKAIISVNNLIKTIGYDEHGMPTVNGKPICTFRYCTFRYKKD
jgi:hypothetical protein